jgi:hypothetical protein
MTANVPGEKVSHRLTNPDRPHRSGPTCTCTRLGARVIRGMQLSAVLWSAVLSGPQSRPGGRVKDARAADAVRDRL